jgi:hypothetical protein
MLLHSYCSCVRVTSLLASPRSMSPVLIGRSKAPSYCAGQLVPSTTRHQVQRSRAAASTSAILGCSPPVTQTPVSCNTYCHRTGTVLRQGKKWIECRAAFQCKVRRPKDRGSDREQEADSVNIVLIHDLRRSRRPLGGCGNIGPRCYCVASTPKLRILSK